MHFCLISNCFMDFVTTTILIVNKTIHVYIYIYIYIYASVIRYHPLTAKL